MRYTVIGISSDNDKIIPCKNKLSIHTNRHRNTNGTSWGWIEGCSKNICWSDNSSFDYEKANDIVKKYNNRQASDIPLTKSSLTMEKPGVKVNFDVFHNIPEYSGASIDDLAMKWFKDESKLFCTVFDFCKYVMKYYDSHVCIPNPDYSPY